MMSDPKYDHGKNSPHSRLLDTLMRDYLQLSSSEEKRGFFSNVKTPLIEPSDENLGHVLVTFLYRENDKIRSIYLYSPATGFPCSPDSQLSLYPGTDIYYLTLLLPNQLRMSYSFLRPSKLYPDEDIVSDTHTPIVYPILSGELKKSFQLFNQLMENNEVLLDQNNPYKITYYKDWENPQDFFAEESIVELPGAPPESVICHAPLSEIKKQNRFLSEILDFKATQLDQYPDYANQHRKYWIYLPPNYAKSKTYPAILFLDGSDYFGLFSVPSILDALIINAEIPPCIAIFLDYSPERRMSEYNCDRLFTQFIAGEFFKILAHQHGLSISSSPELTVIAGFSASGLAAFYAGMICPQRFGQVIAQSPSLEAQKISDIQRLIFETPLHRTRFYLEAGSLETLPAELIFEDGSVQAVSSLLANQKAFSQLKQKGWNAYFHEFMGGHSSICWRHSLPDRIREVFCTR